MELETKHRFDFKLQVAHNKIDAGIGTITWGANNLLLEQVMQEVERVITEKTPLEFLKLLQAI